jgi:purine-binding chemotaxis protein CheW
MESDAKIGIADADNNASTKAGHAPGKILQFVSFRVDKEEFGLDILRVQEIIRVQQLTRVPNAPNFIDGVINLRGRVIPIVGLRKRFGLPGLADDRETRIIVVEMKEAVLGFTVDAVSEVVRVPSERIDPVPRLAGGGREYVSGVGKIGDHLLILLDIDRLMCGLECNFTSAGAPASGGTKALS